MKRERDGTPATDPGLGRRGFLRGTAVTVGMGVLSTVPAGVASAGADGTVPLEKVREETYGGSGDSGAFDVTTLGSGGHVLAGYVRSGGTDDAWLVGDESGGPTWAKTHGEGGNARLFSVTEANGGGYVAAGWSESDGTTTGGDAWLLKVDDSGDAEWSRTFASEGVGLANAVLEADDGHYLAAGWVGTEGGDGASLWTASVDGSGETRWERTYDDRPDSGAHELVETGDDEYLLAGWQASDGDGDEALVGVLDDSGTVRWERTYEGNGHSGALTVIETGDGYLVGGGTGQSESEPHDAWLAKLDGSGAIEWDWIGDEGEGGIVNAVVEMDDGGYLAIGEVRRSEGRFDAWLGTVDDSGTVGWSDTYGEGGIERAYAVAGTDEGSYLVAGQTQSFGRDPNEDDMWLLEMEPTEATAAADPTATAGSSAAAESTTPTATAAVDTPAEGEDDGLPWGWIGGGLAALGGYRLLTGSDGGTESDDTNDGSSSPSVSVEAETASETGSRNGPDGGDADDGTAATRRRSLRDSVESLRSDLEAAESAVADGALDAAESRLDGVESSLKDVEREATTRGFDELEATVQDLRDRHATVESTVADRRTTGGPPETVPSAPDVAIDYADLTVEEPIGAGGNADVKRATVDTEAGSVTVAVKEPRMAGTLHTDVIARLLSEAETWQKLDDHDHVVSVVDYGAEPLPWIAMEYMDAGHLGERLGDLSLPQALWTALSVAEAVAHAHRHGVAHLDLKPENVLFRSVDEGWDVPKVGDWGLSKQLLDHSKSVDGLSPHYAAPEQFDDAYGQVDDVTDVYQLGAVCYGLFTGRPPFEGETAAVMRKVLDEEPTPPTEVNGDLPAALDEVLLTALATDRDDRYEHVLYFRDDLRDLFADGQ